MLDLTAKRTLVKSPPELWSELSDLERLAGHLGAFGEIKITKLEPEHTVAWEGEAASGTVSIEPSGWGTKVTLTAQLEAAEAVVEEPVVIEKPAVVEEPVVVEEPPEPPAPAPRRGFFSWLFRERTGAQWSVPEAAMPEPEPVAVEPEPVAVEPEPIAVEPEPVEPEPEPPNGLEPTRAQEILDEALDALGSAHHRPFSRG